LGGEREERTAKKDIHNVNHVWKQSEKKKRRKKKKKTKNKCLGIEFGFWRERVRGNETQGNVGERCGRKKKKEKKLFYLFDFFGMGKS